MLPPWTKWIAIPISIINAVKSVFKIQKKGENMKTKIIKFFYKAKTVWNMGWI